jgi:hypothetical protein
MSIKVSIVPAAATKVINTTAKSRVLVSDAKTRISINDQNRNNIRTVTIGYVKTNRMEDILDVDASSPNNNDTLVYDSFTKKYVVKQLPTINGGDF